MPFPSVRAFPNISMGTMPSADFCSAVRLILINLSHVFATRSRSPEVSSTAFRASPPNFSLSSESSFRTWNGNTQGYAKRGGKIAVSPIAALPHKALFHEIAHSLLHCAEGDLSDTENTPHDPAARDEVEAEAVALLCCESLGLSGAEFSRGYIQAFLKTGGQGQAISERSAQRI